MVSLPKFGGDTTSWDEIEIEKRVKLLIFMKLSNIKYIADAYRKLITNKEIHKIWALIYPIFLHMKQLGIL